MNPSAQVLETDTILINNSKNLDETTHLAKESIEISELEFQTVLLQHKRIKSNQNGLLFIFNLKDDITCRTASNNQDFCLGSFQSMMLTQGQEISLVFPRERNYHFCIITVDRLETLGNFKADSLQTNFKSKNVHDCWYTGIPNIKLSNFIYDLMNLDRTFSDNLHLLLGYTNIVIGSKLEEYNQFIKGPQKLVDLRTDEINRIHDCIHYIQENYAQPLDVDMLCLKSSLSANKLQMGFKELYGHTVTSFIKNYRLEKAEEFIRTTEMNVSQIVYSVGLTSRSYFSKIFREKYQLSPNEYLRKMKFVVA
ncbi:helix-turn-helix domain-containing protein [Gelidibacter salicanalis]|uniref:Helix-turn-helix transcriptional regulator n=1 Tax=Gelidibacter salicanalis TaxID=291193 RepID=A0A934KR26_9FLAO|nr:AraC family transcriptional regulator [Gelidibacter salicanalis]MBJ7879881.1 helix-turn-helix transcriptional regulator [Gelidibacter salicanalis]